MNNTRKDYVENFIFDDTIKKLDLILAENDLPEFKGTVWPKPKEDKGFANRVRIISEDIKNQWKK